VRRGSRVVLPRRRYMCRPKGSAPFLQGPAQSRVRTQTLCLPVCWNRTIVVASLTGSPRPWASRKGEPIRSANCWSTTQPPRSSKLSASIRSVSAWTAGRDKSSKTNNAERVMSTGFVILSAPPELSDQIFVFGIVCKRFVPECPESFE